MNIFLNFCFHFWGVLGKRMLNPEVLKCHEDLITLEKYVQQGKTMDNRFYFFGYMGARGGGGFNNQTGPILLHIYPLFNNNLHVKYRSNLIRTFCFKIKNVLGPYIQSRGTRGTKMSANNKGK